MPTEAAPDPHTEIAATRTAEAAERIKETAVRTTLAAQRTEATADRRTELAANRTMLAAERTYAAWIRTGLMSLAAGVGAKKALGGVLPEWVVVLTGSVVAAFAESQIRPDAATRGLHSGRGVQLKFSMVSTDPQP